MSDRAFILVLIGWMLAVVVLSFPFPAILAGLLSRLRAARIARVSAREIERQVTAAEDALVKAHSLPAGG